MGVEMARAAKVFDAHLPLNLRRFQAALPTPRSSAMAHQTLPRVRQAPGKPRPACVPSFWKRCVLFCTGIRMSTEDLAGEALLANHRRNMA